MPQNRSKDGPEGVSENEEAQSLPDENALKQAASTAQLAIEAQSAAQSLRNAASSVTDPKKREKLLRDAYDKEVEAHGNSRKARMLSSGAFQGAMGGGGIGGAVGVGVGTVVGTVVGGLTAIPTTGLGALVGSGVGAVHGPFIKLGSIASGGKDEDKKEKKGADGNKEDVKEEDVDEDDMVPDPKVLKEAADAVAAEKIKQRNGEEHSTTEEKEKRKPRKIEIRSQKTQTQAASS